jgi:hypothetical protein
MVPKILAFIKAPQISNTIANMNNGLFGGPISFPVRTRMAE